MSEKHHLPSTGFVRLAALLAPGGPLPISKSSWWQGVRSGRYPAPVKLGPRITAWRVEDVRQLMELGIPLMRNPGPRAAGARKLNEQGTIGRSSYPATGFLKRESSRPRPRCLSFAGPRRAR